MTLESLPVLLTQPDFASAPKLTGFQRTDVADLSEARRVEGYLSQRPIHSFTHKFLFTSRDAAFEFEDFMDAIGSSWKQFWLPSWQAELNPLADVASGATSLTVTAVDYATVYDPTDSNVTKLGHYIFLLDYSGNLFITKITAVATVAGNEVLTLQTAAPNAFTLGQFIVGFVYCVTAITDDVVLDFKGLNQIETSLGVTEAMQIGDGNGS